MLFGFPILLIGQGDITFTAEPNAKRVTENSDFTISFKLTNAKFTKFTPPEFRGFNQVGNPRQLTSGTNFNGDRSSFSTIVYHIISKKAGKYIIPAATAIVNGKTMKTKSFSIEVVKGSKKPVEELPESYQYFIRAEPNDSTPRVGQQVIVNYKLYFVNKIASFNFEKFPEFKNFYVPPSEDNLRGLSYNIEKEEIDGIMYSTKLLKRIAIYPQKEGIVDIDPMIVRLGISDRTNNNNFFRLQTPRYVNYVVDTFKLNVIPFLPNEEPADFTGAVGKYKMVSNVDKRKMTTDQAVIIKMVVQGNGDIKRVKAPKLDLGDDFELYEPSVNEKKTIEYRGQLIGEKEFEYQALPLRPGQYTIQPKFTYYDTEDSRFRTIVSEAVQLEVTQGRKKRTSSIVQNNVKKEIEFLPNSTSTSFSQKDNFFFGSPFFWILTVLPFLILGGALVYRQQQLKKGDVDLDVLKSQGAQSVAIQKLATAEAFKNENNSKSFYDEISKASFGYVGDKLNIPLSELSKSNIQEKLQSLNVSQQYIDEFIKIIKTCEMALFAGMDNSAAMQETYDSAKDVITKIEEELGRREDGFEN